MPDKIIAATLQVDTGTSNQNIKEVNKNLGDVKTSLKDAGNAAGVTGKQIEGSTGSFGKLKDQMTGLPGPLGQAGDGVNKLSVAFKALLANPVVLILAAIVATLALLYKAFTNTFSGGEKVEQVFAGIKAAGQALLDSLDKIGRAIKDVFTFHFGDALDEINGVAQAASDAYNKMAALTKTAQVLAREQATNDLDQAKRQSKLADLRAKAYDDSVPAAKRSALLKELKAESEKNAADDIILAKKVADNKIAQLEVEKDGYLKHFAEIKKIQADQIRVETDSSNELKQIGRQISSADKQDAAEKKQAASEAQASAKEARAKLTEFNNNLRKLQNENELLVIKDGYQKELKALDEKIAEEKRINLQGLREGKLTKDQFNKLNEQADINFLIQQNALTEKHNKEVADKEIAFQKELATITGKTKLDAIKDTREQERVQLQIGYEEKLQDAILRYKEDAVKLQSIKNALDEQLKADQLKLEAKNKKEDDKKAFELAEQAQKAIIEKQDFDFKLKVDAVNAEQKLVQDAFENKIISEIDYNTKIKALADARMQISQLETDHRKAQATEVAGILDNLAAIVGRQTAAGKVLGIATALINTYQGATEALKEKSTLPAPFSTISRFVSAAAIVANGLATVKKIVAVPVPGGGGSGASVGSAPSPTPLAPISPTASTTSLDANTLNGIGNATKQPVRAYVLDADVANGRERDERLNRQARLGG